MAGKLRVVLLFGGRSSEHSISCATAAGVLEALDRERYEVIPVGITRAGAFTLQPDDADLFRLNRDELPVVRDNASRIQWPETAGSRVLGVRDGDGAVRDLGAVDVVFPILHGPFGEDGTVQGMLELYGLPYVGSGVLASAVAMDKHFTKTVLQQRGIPVAPWRTVSAYEWATDAGGVRESVADLSLPLFVKPARAGSSVGVSKVSATASGSLDVAAFDAAMTTAFAEDDRVLVEAGVPGREVEIAILGGHPGQRARASVAGEIVLRDREFYDFAAKYLDAPGIDLVCPAELTESEHAEMAELAITAFEAVGAEGLSRVDFFLTEQGFVVNEINTMPGFTPISMFPLCWQRSGVSYPQLIDELIALALD